MNKILEYRIYSRENAWSEWLLHSKYSRFQTAKNILVVEKLAKRERIWMLTKVQETVLLESPMSLAIRPQLVPSDA